MPVYRSLPFRKCLNRKSLPAASKSLGLGKHLQPEDTTAASLREAVSQTDGDPHVLKRIQDMQKRIKQAGGAEKAADEIEAFLAPAGVK